MDSQDQSNRSTELSLIQPVEQTQVKNFMANVFAYMFLALGVSALFAYLFSTNLQLLQYLVSSTGRGLNALGYIVMFAPLGFVLLMSFGYSRLSAPVLVLLFVIYSALNGISFSFILLSYTSGTILACFLSAAAMLALWLLWATRRNRILQNLDASCLWGLSVSSWPL